MKHMLTLNSQSLNLKKHAWNLFLPSPFLDGALIEKRGNKTALRNYSPVYHAFFFPQRKQNLLHDRNLIVYESSGYK